MSRPLNLATRPFRNETLPALAFALIALLLVLVTVRHAVTLAGLRPGFATPQQREVAALEAEATRLRSEHAASRGPEPDAKAIPQWALIKDLVDQRALRWTELLAVLEQTLPPGIRVVNLTPRVESGRVSLEMTVMARNATDGLELLPILEQRPEFEGVYPVSVSTRDDGSEYRYAMVYRPPSAPQPSPQEPAGEAQESRSEQQAPGQVRAADMGPEARP
jgi:hypothetical protein